MADNARIRELGQWPLGIIIATLWIGWDFTAKALVEQRLLYAPALRQTFMPGLDLQLVYDRPPWPIAAMLVSAVAAIVLLLLLFRIRRTAPAVAVALGLGGFLGDLLDQLPDQRLTHFIMLHPFELSFPCFNFSEFGIGALVAYAAIRLVARLARRRADATARS